MHMGYPTYLRGVGTQAAEEHWTTLPSELKEDLLRFIATYQTPHRGELDQPCYWFDLETRRCKHHEHRPRVCRDFKIGSKDCLGWRQQYLREVEVNAHCAGTSVTNRSSLRRAL